MAFPGDGTEGMFRDRFSTVISPQVKVRISSAGCPGSSSEEKSHVGGVGFSRFLKRIPLWADPFRLGKQKLEAGYLASNKHRPFATTTQGSPPYCSTDFINSYSNGNHDNKTEDQRLANGPYSERAEKKSTGRFLGKDSTETQTSSRKNNNNNGIKPLNTKVSSPLPRERERERDAVSSESNPRPTNKDLSKDFDRGEGTVLPPAGQKVNQANYSNFRPMNSRNNNFLGGQQISPLPSQQRGSANQQSANNYTLPGRDSEDLVAMGTSPLYGRGRLKEGINGSGMYYTQSSTATLGSVRKLHKSNGFSRSKESEPKYADPFSNGPPTFNQRLAEIASLEQETIRYERTKKFKKKKSETT